MDPCPGWWAHLSLTTMVRRCQCIDSLVHNLQRVVRHVWSRDDRGPGGPLPARGGARGRDRRGASRCHGTLRAARRHPRRDAGCGASPRTLGDDDRDHARRRGARRHPRRGCGGRGPVRGRGGAAGTRVRSRVPGRRPRVCPDPLGRRGHLAAARGFRAHGRPGSTNDGGRLATAALGDVAGVECAPGGDRRGVRSHRRWHQFHGGVRPATRRRTRQLVCGSVPRVALRRADPRGRTAPRGCDAVGAPAGCEASGGGGGCSRRRPRSSAHQRCSPPPWSTTGCGSDSGRGTSGRGSADRNRDRVCPGGGGHDRGRPRLPRGGRRGRPTDADPAFRSGRRGGA
ncbi:hypothetical protein OCAE111667_26460 [Occultella aeris]|uniref:Uncharacterized protein n=1 Tax=Occultella aeris TaxID=2761496 RepID=A0A7M4DEP0_9MICO|nr:hypothetical protein HALOF300_00580 [Occultella aeris]